MKNPLPLHLSIAILFSLACWARESASGAVLWIEGENFSQAQVQRHPWWYDKVKTDRLSGTDFISNWSDKPGLIHYSVRAPAAGNYELWARANPVQTKLAVTVNQSAEIEIDFNKEQQDNENIAADDKPDLRFLAWVHVGNVLLREGKNSIQFRMHSDTQNHGMLDCFVLANEPFQPHGILKPGELVESAEKGWFAFTPGQDIADAKETGEHSTIDLRSLNEKQAGEGGFIQARHENFVHGETGEPIRFWGVNGPPENIDDPVELKRCARMLAGHGVNLVRLHSGYFDNDGNINLTKIQHALNVVETMKAEGIYTDFSVYWFSFLTPKTNTPWLVGYDGKQKPVAALMFNPEFQREYQRWWRALLTTPSKATGKRLIDEPACAALEIQNEDSLFFWTFSDASIPDAEMRLIEKRYGAWLIKKYQMLDGALLAWNSAPLPRDVRAEGRMAFQPIWNMFNQQTARDKDAAAFLTEFQKAFYQSQHDFLRRLGFKGVITTSGWTTASPQYLGPLDKYTNTAGDYIDRHGYFAGARHGENEGWALTNGQVYSDRSALRFDGSEPGKPKDFSNPVIDPHYDGKPSMTSETSFDRPNRYRSEAPLYDACYGALQNSSGFVFFALDTPHWSVKPGYFMQPWTMMSPAAMGQFPAAAVIFRKALVAPGERLVELNLKLSDLENLKGTPMPQDASIDEMRLKEIPPGAALQPNSLIDPLVHYAGRTNVNFITAATAGPSKVVDLSPYIDHQAQTVLSSNHQLKLNYGMGSLVVNAPAAQGISGDLKSLGKIETADFRFESTMELGHIVAVALDDKPLVTSQKILLQVMSEERPSGFKATEGGNGKWRITDIGHDPWLVKSFNGLVICKRRDAAKLNVTPLDLNGRITRTSTSGNLSVSRSAAEIRLDAQTVYYVITP